MQKNQIAWLISGPFVGSDEEKPKIFRQFIRTKRGYKAMPSTQCFQLDVASLSTTIHELILEIFRRRKIHRLAKIQFKVSSKYKIFCEQHILRPK